MKRKILAIFIASVFLLTAFCGLSVSAEDGAENISVYSGTPDIEFWGDVLEKDEPCVVVIETADQLMGFAEMTLYNTFKDYTIKLGADMVINTGDASEWAKTKPEHAWTCAPLWGYGFDGDFDGQGHVVSGLYGVDPDNQKEIGFFGCVRPSGERRIENVSIVNSYFFGKEKIGGLIGHVEPYVTTGAKLTVDNVYVSANIEATTGSGGNVARAGGLIGNINPTAYISAKTENVDITVNVTNSSFKGSVKIADSVSSAGGIAGYVGRPTTVENCSVDATISGKYKLGGIVGDTYNTTTINNCSVKGAVKAKSELAGGLVGIATKTSVICNNCSVDANLSAGNTDWAARVGMLVARLRSANLSAQNCIVRGKITAIASNVAGLVGEISDEDAQNVASNLSVSIKNVLMLVDKNDLKALIITTDKERIDATDTIAFTLENIVYEGTSALQAVEKNVTCVTTGLDGFTATAKETSELKGANGAALFTGWTAVDGDYPVPVSFKAIPTIDLEKYINAVYVAPPESEDDDDNGSNNSNTSNNNSNSNSNSNNTNNNNNETTDTAAPETNAPETEAPATKKGCGSTVGIASVALLTVISAAGITLSKKRK